MSLVSDFIEPVRWLVGDHNDAGRLYDDSQYQRGIRVIVKGGQVSGYSLLSDNNTITPDVPDGGPYLLLSAKVARGFVASVPSKQSVRTRGWSQSTGDFELLLEKLEQLIQDCENGNMGLGFQNYAGFLAGYRNVENRAWDFMTRLISTGVVDQIMFPGQFT